MSFAPSIEIKTVTFKDWGYYQDNTYINNSGGFVSGDDYWQIKGAIDVSYEASVGGSFQIGGMTFFESNRTNVNFYSSETVNSSKRISTVYLSAQNQVIPVPSDAKIMVLCVRTIRPDESATVTVTLRQQTTIWNTSDGMPPKAGTIYNYNGTIAHQIGKLYEFDGLSFSQIAKVYDWNGTLTSLIYSAEETIATDLTASVFDYIEYQLAGWGWQWGDTSTFSLAGRSSASFVGSVTVSMAWSHSYGLYSKSRVELKLNDGTVITLATGSGRLYGQGSVYIYEVNATVDLSGYSASQLSSACVRVGLGDLSVGDGTTSGPRHDANLTINTIVAG